jgi:hypothetical protein
VQSPPLFGGHTAVEAGASAGEHVGHAHYLPGVAGPLFFSGHARMQGLSSHPFEPAKRGIRILRQGSVRIARRQFPRDPWPRRCRPTRVHARSAGFAARRMTARFSASRRRPTRRFGLYLPFSPATYSCRFSSQRIFICVTRAFSLSQLSCDEKSSDCFPPGSTRWRTAPHA